MIHINLNMIFYTHVSLGKTRNIPVKYLFSPNQGEKYMGARHELQTDKGTIPPCLKDSQFSLNFSLRRLFHIGIQII